MMDGRSGLLQNVQMASPPLAGTLQIWIWMLARSIVRFSSRHSLTLRGLPLHHWVAAVLEGFYFTLIPLTVDCGVFSRDEISQTDLLQGWHPTIVPHLNSLSSSEEQLFFVFFNKCLQMLTTWQVLDFIHVTMESPIISCVSSLLSI